MTTFNALFRGSAASFEDMSLAAIAKLVLREGCIGETVAALEAWEAAEQACDPAVRAAFQRIARDEQAHAELAFQFLNWAFAHASRAERAEMARAAELQLADFERPLLSSRRRASTSDALATHGVVSAASTRLIHLTALHEVVRPLLGELFGEIARA